jgi:uncharacterized membrane protein
METASRTGEHENTWTRPKEPRMLNGPLRFHRAAEARGYPALLLVVMVCLTAVVAAIALLALIPTWFALAFALLTLLAASGALSGAVSAAFSDAEDSEDGADEPASIRATGTPERGRSAPRFSLNAEGGAA